MKLQLKIKPLSYVYESMFYQQRNADLDYKTCKLTTKQINFILLYYATRIFFPIQQQESGN